MSYDTTNGRRPYEIQQKTLFMIRQKVGAFQEQIVLACATRIRQSSDNATTLVENLALIERRQVRLREGTDSRVGNEMLEPPREESFSRSAPMSMAALDEIVAARVRRMRSRIDTYA